MIAASLQIFTPDTRSAVLAGLLAAQGLHGAVERKAASGKPYLAMPSGQQHGLAISHLRQATPPLGLMAVAETPLLGLDAELWELEKGDTAFLHSIMAPEDEPLVRRLRATGRDAATFLWLAKEAALKASGEVMTDPRNISVELSSNGHFWVSTSRTAQQPIEAACMRIWSFSDKGLSSPGVIALAFAGAMATAASQQGIGISAQGLSLSEPF